MLPLARKRLWDGFFPSAIVYTDGTTWRPHQDRECFTTFWRDKPHPALPALPPRPGRTEPRLEQKCRVAPLATHAQTKKSSMDMQPSSGFCLISEDER